MEPIRDCGYERLDLDAIRGRMKEMDVRSEYPPLYARYLPYNSSITAFYTELASFANYGPMYRRIQKYYLAAGSGGAMDALVQIRGDDMDITK